MAGTAYELMGRAVDISYGSASGTRKWIVLGANTEAEAVDVVFPEADFGMSGMPLQGISAEEKSSKVWMATAKYQATQSVASPDGQTGTGHDPGTPPTRPAEGDPLGPEYSFSTMGGTTKIYQSIATLESLAADGGAVPDTYRAIGAHGDSDQVDGVDIVTPNLTWTKTIKVGAVNMKYLNRLADYTGKVNSTAFYGFEDGEVLFMGCTGQYKISPDNLNWTLTYSFAISKNVDTLEVSDEITFPLGKRGWEYVWASYAKKKATTALSRQVIYAYIEQVYEERDFKGLGI
mgnify:FL=1